MINARTAGDNERGKEDAERIEPNGRAKGATACKIYARTHVRVPSKCISAAAETRVYAPVRINSLVTRRIERPGACNLGGKLMPETHRRYNPFNSQITRINRIIARGKIEGAIDSHEIIERQFYLGRHHASRISRGIQSTR